MDLAIQQLVGAVVSRGEGANLLWAVDEHVDAAAAAAIANCAGATALTNRRDVAALLGARGIAVALNDFDFSAAPVPDRIAFRVAKEKALVHHVINQALARLPVGGVLWLAGAKHEGIKTYIEKAARLAAGTCDIERGSIWLARMQRGAQLGEMLPDQDYPRLRPVALRPDFEIWSKPGVFGWQKLDAGSEFLIQHLSQVWPQAPARVLDLGCGYGYLTLMAARQWRDTQFVATDNNVAAIAACERNVRAFGIDGRCVLADCGDTVEGGFDALLCNPPFHQGFDTEDELTERFLLATRRLLRKGGRALFVVNQFIALERRAEQAFASARILARNPSFKLVVLER